MKYMAMSTIGRGVRQITGETEAIRTKSGLTAGGKPFDHYFRGLVAKDELRLECIPADVAGIARPRLARVLCHICAKALASAAPSRHGEGPKLCLRRSIRFQKKPSEPKTVIWKRSSGHPWYVDRGLSQRVT